MASELEAQALGLSEKGRPVHCGVKERHGQVVP